MAPASSSSTKYPILTTLAAAAATSELKLEPSFLFSILKTLKPHMRRRAMAAMGTRLAMARKNATTRVQRG